MNELDIVKPILKKLGKDCPSNNEEQLLFDCLLRDPVPNVNWNRYFNQVLESGQGPVETFVEDVIPLLERLQTLCDYAQLDYPQMLVTIRNCFRDFSERETSLRDRVTFACKNQNAERSRYMTDAEVSNNQIRPLVSSLDCVIENRISELCYDLEREGELTESKLPDVSEYLKPCKMSDCESRIYGQTYSDIIKLNASFAFHHKYNLVYLPRGEEYK